MKYILAYNYVGSMHGIRIVVGDEQTIIDYLTSTLEDSDDIYTLDDLIAWVEDDANEWQHRYRIFTVTDMSGNDLIRFC